MLFASDAEGCLHIQKAPVLVVGDGLQDGVDAACLTQPRLVLLRVLHEDGQQLAGVLLVAVHLAAALLHLAQDPLEQLRGRKRKVDVRGWPPSFCPRLTPSSQMMVSYDPCILLYAIRCCLRTKWTAHVRAALTDC